MSDDVLLYILFFFVFFNDTATTEIYTLSLHDALPIWRPSWVALPRAPRGSAWRPSRSTRSEEHTSELQLRQYLVCRLLLEKKKTSCNATSCHATRGIQQCACADRWLRGSPSKLSTSIAATTSWASEPVMEEEQIQSDRKHPDLHSDPQRRSSE